jgi:hypothetical protein
MIFLFFYTLANLVNQIRDQAKTKRDRSNKERMPIEIKEHIKQSGKEYNDKKEDTAFE